MTSIKYGDLELAFEFVSSAPPFQNSAHVDRETGRIFWRSTFDDTEGDVPSDLENADRYATVPHKHDLDLGQHLALKFVDEHLPQRADEVARAIHGRGGYARFKSLLARERLLDAWFAYEAAETERALRGWCAQHDLQLIP
jgi:hypothetical protein